MHFYFIALSGRDFNVLVEVGFSFQADGLLSVEDGVVRDADGATVFPVPIEVPAVRTFMGIAPLFEAPVGKQVYAVAMSGSGIVVVGEILQIGFFVGEGGKVSNDLNGFVRVVQVI